MEIAALALLGAVAGLITRYYTKWDWILLYRLNIMSICLTRILRYLSMPLICFSVARGVDSYPPLNRRNAVRLLYSVGTTLMSMIIGLCVVQLLIPGLDIAEAPPFFRWTAFAELIMSLMSGSPQCLQYFTYSDTAVSTLHSLSLEKQVLDWPNHLTLILVSLVFGCLIRAPSEPNFTVNLHEGSKVILRQSFKLLYVAAITMSMVNMYRVSLDDVLKLIIFQGVVLSGLVIQGCVLLPLLYLALVRKDPLILMKRLFYTMRKDLLFTFFPSAEVIRTGTAAELMNGTALYGAAIVLFINKLNGYHVEMPQLSNMFLIVLITSCQGRDGIPDTGSLTTWFLLSVLNLPLSAAGLLLFPEVLMRFPIWLLNRLSAAIGEEVADFWAPESDDLQAIELQSMNLPMRNNSSDAANAGSLTS